MCGLLLVISKTMRNLIFISLLFVSALSFSQGLVPGIVASSGSSGGGSPSWDTTGLFTPANTEGWYIAHADYITTATGVSLWEDISGNGNDLSQATAGNQPSFAGDSVTFDGTDDYIRITTLTMSQPITVYMVVTFLEKTSQFFSLSYTETAFLQVDGSGYIVMNAGVELLDYFADADQDVPSIQTFVFNGTSSLIQLNDETPATGNAGTNGNNSIHLGTAGTPMNFSIKELIVRTETDDATDISNIIGYLNDKYNLY